MKRAHMWLRRGLLALIAVLAGTLLAAPVAHGFVYWANGGGTTLGRANLDGLSPDESFITLAGSTGAPYGVAVDGSHVYFSGNNVIGRANLDGTGVDQSFISAANAPQMIAVDGAYIYWANYNDGTIGRANLNGTGVNQSFINTGNFGVEGVAVDSAHIYWTHLSANSPIGRANIDGTGITPNFIPGANYPDGVAVDANYVYWANTGGNIGRANLNGTGVNQDFITTSEPCGLAVDSAHVYWTLNSANAVARANLDGTGVNESFIAGAKSPCGVAVDGLPTQPEVQTGAASAVTQSSSALNGTVNPEGSPTSYHFEYGPTTAYGTSVPVPDAAVGSDTTLHALSQAISGLQPGTAYHFRLVATNAVGTVSSTDSTFKTVAAPGAPPTLTAPGTVLATAPIPPRLTSVSQSDDRWREGNALPHISRVRKPPVGTTFRFTLNESARVQFAFKQRLPGRSLAGRCVAPAAKNRNKPNCTRLVARGTLSLSLGAGTHSVRFQGRLSKRKKLPVGRYTLAITGTNSAGQRATATLTFMIVA